MTEISPDDRALLDGILKRVRRFEETIGRFYSEGLWARMDRLYHGYTDFKISLQGVYGPEREALYRDARKEFGHELFIPYAFSIVETVLPALLSNRPRILVLPQDGASERNVENMKAIIDTQQAQINLEIKLQSVVKSGLIYGLGVGKSYWLRRDGIKPVVQPLSRLHPQRVLYDLTNGRQGQQYGVTTCAEPLFDDPTFEPIPIRDFGWDTMGSGIDTCRCMWHRTWRDTDYVLDRLQDPLGWQHMAQQGAQLTLEDVSQGGASMDLYRKALRPQFMAQGVPLPDPRETIHEVLEYHDRGQIVTVLDRRFIVRVIPNETWYGRLPFPIYRPTEVPNQMVGKGEIEPGEDLFEEVNQMRTDRRWAALMRLNPPLFYQSGVVDPDKIRVGPGEMNEVIGSPQELIWPLEIGDVPGSSYRETAEIASDIVRMSGISDAFAGGDSAAETATGIQLQLARASARIQLKTQRAEKELIKPLAEHWVALNQRHILEAREVVTPAPPVPGQPERAWAFYRVGPQELAGHFAVDPDGGSTSPENVPQKRQDAQFGLALLSSPAGMQLLDARQIMVWILDNAGVKNPEAYLSAGMQVPPETLDLIAQHLSEMGVDPGAAQQLVAGSLQEAIEAKDQAAQGADHGAPEPGGPPTPQPGQQPQ